MSTILKAARYAAAKHGDQKRKFSGDPYVLHPMRVAGRIAMEPWTTEAHVAAAWLHDVLEDCAVTVDEIRSEFDDQVAALVDALTNRSKATGLPRAERKAIDRDRLRLVPWPVKAIKLADRADNLREMDRAPGGFLRVYAAESRALLEVLRDAHVPSLVAELETALERVQARLNGRPPTGSQGHAT